MSPDLRARQRLHHAARRRARPRDRRGAEPPSALHPWPRRARDQSQIRARNPLPRRRDFRRIRPHRRAAQIRPRAARPQEGRGRSTSGAQQAPHFGLVDPRQAARHDLHPGSRQSPLALRCRKSRSCRHARSPRDRPAAHRARRSHQDRALRPGRRQALSLRAEMGFRNRDRRCRGRSHCHLGPSPRGGGRPCHAAGLYRHDHAASAVLLRHPRQWRARLRSRPRRRGGGARRAPRHHHRTYPAAPCGRPLAISK